jgi:excisionase family DNA binding protein
MDAGDGRLLFRVGPIRQAPVGPDPAGGLAWLFKDVQVFPILGKIPTTGRVPVPGEEAMKDDTGEIFTFDEVAAYLKVGKRTVYRLAAAKKIPAFKVGGTWRFSRQEIDQWIKRQMNDDTSRDDRRGNE